MTPSNADIIYGSSLIALPTQISVPFAEKIMQALRGRAKNCPRDLSLTVQPYYIDHVLKFADVRTVFVAILLGDIHMWCPLDVDYHCTFWTPLTICLIWLCGNSQNLVITWNRFIRFGVFRCIYHSTSNCSSRSHNFFVPNSPNVRHRSHTLRFNPSPVQTSYKESPCTHAWWWWTVSQRRENRRRRRRSSSLQNPVQFPLFSVPFEQKLENPEAVFRSLLGSITCILVRCAVHTSSLNFILETKLNLPNSYSCSETSYFALLHVILVPTMYYVTQCQICQKTRVKYLDSIFAF